jgi:nucleoside phosphorylase
VDAAAGFRPDAVISTGFCGALEQDLEIAEIVVGTSILTGATSARHQKVYPARQPECPSGQGLHPRIRTRFGVVCSIGHVARTSEEKASLQSLGACAVEMEAAGVAERAQALGLPFHCVKAVTDLAGETMANDFDSALRPDGHFDTMLLLRRSLRRPAARLPELLRLRNRCIQAARVLGEFLADCRF